MDGSCDAKRPAGEPARKGLIAFVLHCDFSESILRAPNTWNLKYLDQPWIAYHRCAHEAHEGR